jgi:hypothetical protein
MATPERHAKAGTPTPGNIPARETIPCSDTGCEFSYTLSYTDNENFLSRGELNVAKMHGWLAR